MNDASQSRPCAPLVTLMICQLAALFARAYLEVQLIDSGEPKAYAQALSYLVVPPILIALIYPILREYRSLLLALLRCRRVTIRMIVFAVLLGFALRIAYWGGLISLVSFGIVENGDPTVPAGPIISLACPDVDIFAASLLVAAILVPFTEEIIHRGMILQTLIGRGKIMAVVVSAALFAVVHDPQGMLVAFTVGVFLGSQVIRCKTLWAPMITHSAYNAITVVDSECVHKIWNPAELTTSILAAGVVAALLTLACLLIAVILVQGTRDRGTGVPRLL